MKGTPIPNDRPSNIHASNIIQKEKVILIICAYTYMNVIAINEKVALNLDENKGEYKGGCVGRKWKRAMMEL